MATATADMPHPGVSEIESEASVGFGEPSEEFAVGTARWFLPEGMIPDEGDACPDNLRILRVRGEAVKGEEGEGDRHLVATARRGGPTTGEMFVPWDGNGVMVKRIEIVPNADPPRQLRLITAKPEYTGYTCEAQGVHVVGKVLWNVRRTWPSRSV